MKSKTYKRDLLECLNIGHDVVERLFNLFFTTIETELEKLESSILEDDMEKVYVISHKISGSASNLRLDEIMTLAKTIEESAKERQKCDYISLHKKLQDAFYEAKSEVEKEEFVSA